MSVPKRRRNLSLLLRTHNICLDANPSTRSAPTLHSLGQFPSANSLRSALREVEARNPSTTEHIVPLQQNSLQPTSVMASSLKLIPFESLRDAYSREGASTLAKALGGSVGDILIEDPNKANPVRLSLARLENGLDLSAHWYTGRHPVDKDGRAFL